MRGEICAADGIGPLSGETLEDLQFQGLQILQKTRGFRFGLDAVLLADFARGAAADVVADLGTGTGILPLLLCGQGKGAVFHAFEIQGEMADMASRTVRLNGLAEKIHIWHLPITSCGEALPPNACDLVVCNPPYYEPGKTQKGAETGKTLARHQAEDGLQPWLRAAYGLLRGKGRLAVVYPAGQLLALLDGLDRAGLRPKRLRLVHQNEQADAVLALVEAVKDARPGLAVLPPLLLRELDGRETAEYRRIYHME